DELQNFEFASSEFGITIAFEARRFRHARTEHNFSTGDAANSATQAHVFGVLQDVTARAGIDRMPNQRVFGVHAEHQNDLAWKFLENRLGGSKTAQAGQRTIHDDDVGTKLASQADRIIAIACFGDHLNVRFVLENAPKAEAHKIVIVHQQHGYFGRLPGRLALDRFIRHFADSPRAELSG